MGTFLCKLVCDLHRNERPLHHHVMDLQETLEPPKPGAGCGRHRAKSSQRVPVSALNCGCYNILNEMVSTVMIVGLSYLYAGQTYLLRGSTRT